MFIVTGIRKMIILIVAGKILTLEFFSNLPLAARAALQFVDGMNRNQTRIITGVWCDSIDISEYDYHYDESYEYATIRFEKVTLNEGVTY